MKTHLGSSFVFAREIRPKEIMSGHNLGDPPMKKSKTEQPGPNVQNGQYYLQHYHKIEQPKNITVN